MSLYVHVISGKALKNTYCYEKNEKANIYNICFLFFPSCQVHNLNCVNIFYKTRFLNLKKKTSFLPPLI